MDRVVTFVGGPYHDRKEYVREVPPVIEKAGDDGKLYRYERWFGWSEGVKPVAFESVANATYVLQGMTEDDKTAAIRSLSAPAFVTGPDK